MKGEMYVVKLISISERARAIATGILGTGFREKQLEKLRDPDALPVLARELNCPDETKVFEEFSKRIQETLDQHTLDRFTFSSFRVLCDKYFSLARLLDCSPDDVLGNLFDPGALKRTLQDIYAPPTPDASILALLRDIQANARSIEPLHGTNENDWGKIVNGEQWLLGSAEQALRHYAESQQWPTDDVTRILATYLRELRSGRAEQGPERSPVFDALALTYLRQRLQFLVLQLREEAVEYAKEAHESNPSQLALSYLPAWLEIYERRAMSRALPYLVPEKKPLSTFVLRQNCEILPLPPGITQQPDPERNFDIANPDRRMKGIVKKRELGTFDVHCYLQGETIPRPVLHFKNLPINTFEHLQRVIADLSGKDLSPQGDSIGERLLNTLVVPDRFLWLLSFSVRKLGLTFVQCMVLCGTSLPIDMDIPGREDLSDKLPYEKLDATKDIEFPRDVNAIAEALRGQYSHDPSRIEPA